MIESPVSRSSWPSGRKKRPAKRRGETQRRVILNVLVARFGPEPQTLGTALDAIDDEVRLDALVESAALCPDLKSFRERLSP